MASEYSLWPWRRRLWLLIGNAAITGASLALLLITGSLWYLIPFTPALFGTLLMRYSVMNEGRNVNE